jgi:hypothetical protein
MWAENGWNEATIRLLGDKVTTTKFGIGVDEYDPYRSSTYQQTLGKYFALLMPTGAFNRTYIEKAGTTPARTFRDIVLQENQTLFIQGGFWHLDIETKLQSVTSKQALVEYMKDISAFHLGFVKDIISAGGNTVYINFYNEPWWYDSGNVGWLNSPYYRWFGQDCIVEAYLSYYNTAVEYGLSPGKDFRLIVNVDGIFYPNKKLYFALDELIRTKKEIARRLGIQDEQIQLDLGIQWRFDGRVPPKDGRYKIPSVNELQKAFDIINDYEKKIGTVLPIHITEFEIAGVTEEDRAKMMIDFSHIALTNRVISITYNGTLRSPSSPFVDDRNNWFDHQYKPTKYYYLFMANLLKAGAP